MWAFEFKTPRARIVLLYPTIQEVAECARPGGFICEVPDDLCSKLEHQWRGAPATDHCLLVYLDSVPVETKVAV